MNRPMIAWIPEPVLGALCGREYLEKDYGVLQGFRKGGHRQVPEDPEEGTTSC